MARRHAGDASTGAAPPRVRRARGSGFAMTNTPGGYADEPRGRATCPCLDHRKTRDGAGLPAECTAAAQGQASKCPCRATRTAVIPATRAGRSARPRGCSTSLPIRCSRGGRRPRRHRLVEPRRPAPLRLYISGVCGCVSHDLLRTEFPGKMTAVEFEATVVMDGEWSGELVHVTRDGRRVAVDARLRVADDDRLVLEADRDATPEQSEARASARARQQEVLAALGSGALILERLDRTLADAVTGIANGSASTSCRCRS